jgi:GTP-binding protein
MSSGEGNGNSVVIADIPGLIDGAHENRGLGVRFLKHIERCTTLLFLIDMAGTDNRSPVEDYSCLLNELGCYDKALLKKGKIIVANKMDVPSAAENLKIFQLKYGCKIVEISCATGDGIGDLMAQLRHAAVAKKT